mmetsp:Transcript_17416/g.45488  ORF Transcript_17416/g.45488 Transcript_17416/m.45488 type:complete len:341 (+) Transcript_17416:155-1177(+)
MSTSAGHCMKAQCHWCVSSKGGWRLAFSLQGFEFHDPSLGITRLCLLHRLELVHALGLVLARLLLLLGNLRRVLHLLQVHANGEELLFRLAELCLECCAVLLRKLSLHLQSPPADKEGVVSNAELKDALVDFKLGRQELEVGRLLGHHFDSEFLVVERNVANLAPREAKTWSDLVVLLIDVHSEVVHTQPKTGAFLVANFKVRYAILLQVLRNGEVVHHGNVLWHSALRFPRVHHPLFPLVRAEPVLCNYSLRQLACHDDSSRAVLARIVVPKFSLHRLPGEKHAQLRWAVDVAVDNIKLDLLPEEAGRHGVLHLIRHRLGVKLHTKMELQRNLLLVDIL